MRLNPFCSGVVSLMFFILHASSALLYVDLNSANPLSPYSDWSTAATNIQDAIDASGDGDQIWVTNGIYQTGGRVMAGNLTNRVALNKAVTVQSVNGPWMTIIQGAGATNGTAAVRCAWLTNNAALIGFTLKWGATRTSGDTYALESGGGVWCATSNAVVANCVIISNLAWWYGGGAYQGTLNNCLISSNGVFASPSGAAAYLANLNNCTVVSNTCIGTCQGRLTNCIVYYNSAPFGNYSGGAFSYCCTIPLVGGSGNFTNAPQLFADGVHLTSTSPCIGAGINVATGTDIFGEAWANPPSVGCAETTGAPIVAPPQIQLTSDPVGFTVVNSALAGQPPFTCWWIKDGTPLQDNGHFSFTQTTNLVATGVNFSDAGNYQLVVSNTFGVVTSAVAQLVVHCVDVAGANPVAPYSTWATAATNIQDAITTSVAGDIVLVTNGLYAVGGKSMDGVITNRVSVDKAIIVQSMNGPNATIIQGAWDPTSTNGPGAVRCAWLTNNAILSGFTLRSGATRTMTGSVNQSVSGGGVLGTSNNVVVYNCAIVTNFASYVGGGAVSVTLNYCTLAGNHAFGSGTDGGWAGAGSGGGAANCNLMNCLITSNVADQESGGGVQNCSLKNCALTKNMARLYGCGAYQGTLLNCTLTSNCNISATYSAYGGAVAYATLTNCIVDENLNVGSGPTNYNINCTFSYSDTDPLPSGAGNIDVDPQLLADGVHLTATSRCIGTGTASVVSGADIDGQPWNNPPSIGCDEWQPTPVIGVQPTYQVNSPAHGLTFNVIVAGQSPFTFFWSKDGSLIQDDMHYSNSGTANLVVNNFGPDDAGLYQVVVSNAFGVVTSQVAQVVIHMVDAADANPAAPYSTWATAATNIQDAINVASAGDIVLVTNGVYATGGKIEAGDLTNRVVLDRPVTVMSVNGYAATVIQGAWDPASTNGPGAVRCAWLGNGAALIGFTLQNGATQTTGDSSSGGPLESGGAVWCVSANGVVSNCLLTNNTAIYGGGIAYGTLNDSLVIDNLAMNGGGAYYATLNNCTVVNNYTTTSFTYGAGTYDCIARNSIVLNNFDNWPLGSSIDNYYYDPFYFSVKYSYSCTYPTIFGTGNINGGTMNPQFLDLFHIASTSPCRGAGSILYSTGSDLDGELWANPPSMGCDEVIDLNLVGPLSVSIQAYQTNLLVNRNAFFEGNITGRASRVEWLFGDGPTITNYGASISHQWTNSGDYNVTFTVYNNDNPSGVSAGTVIHVQPLNVPQLQSAVLRPMAFNFNFRTNERELHHPIRDKSQSPVAWQTLQTIYYNSEGVIQINDSARTNTARFYRVLAQ